jgi:heterodisulfide reductase subunit C/nitrate reductase gamma subunit
MFYSISLYLALGVFVIGSVYKLYTWLTWKVGVFGSEFSGSQRLWAAIHGTAAVIFSAKVLVLFRTLILDVILQLRIAKESRLRWIGHLLMYSGFTLLLLMHAMENFITAKLFSNYYSTLNPFLFLRNFFGLMIFTGIGIAVYRRFILKVPRLMTNIMDRYIIAILAVIIVSGFLLEGAKMSSYSEFTRMVEDYSFIYDEADHLALESYWSLEYGTVSPNVKSPFKEQMLTEGFGLHEAYCAHCHAPNKSAFAGYGVARAMGPIALFLDRINTTTVLWHIHFLACFFGLAYLPFSKMFHIFSSSFGLLANAVMNPKQSNPANIATRQALELDACTRCGTCSLRCSVAVAYEANGNPMVLPSEKLTFLKDYAAGKILSQAVIDAVHEGFCLCTNCNRCTAVCPVGINLKDLWLSVREPILEKGGPDFLVLSPFSFYRGLNRRLLPARGYERPLNDAMETMAAAFPLVRKTESLIPVIPSDPTFKLETLKSSCTATFVNCFACENCTTVCPVVQAYEDPQEAVGLLPHQIMRSLGLGQKDLALGSPMLWNCLTCYQCQEHCPQGVKVTDILYELKNMAVRGATVGSMNHFSSLDN